MSQHLYPAQARKEDQGRARAAARCPAAAPKPQWSSASRLQRTPPAQEEDPDTPACTKTANKTAIPFGERMSSKRFSSHGSAEKRVQCSGCSDHGQIRTRRRRTETTSILVILKIQASSFWSFFATTFRKMRPFRGRHGLKEGAV